MIAQYYGTSLISRIIKWRTYGAISHTSWVSPHTGMVVEAWMKGGVRRNFDLNDNHTPGTVIDLYRVEGMTRDKHRSIEAFLCRQIGKKYAFRQILRFISRRADVLRELELWMLPSKLESWFCSELIFTALRTAGLNLLKASANRVSPTVLGYSSLMIPYGRWIVGETMSLSEAAERVAEVGRPVGRKLIKSKNASLCNKNADRLREKVRGQKSEVGGQRVETALENGCTGERVRADFLSSDALTERIA